jgi:hypothetical protein
MGVSPNGEGLDQREEGDTSWGHAGEMETIPSPAVSPSMTSRRFPPPWRADKMPGGYVVRDGRRLHTFTPAITKPKLDKRRCSRQTRRGASPSISRGCPSWPGRLSAIEEIDEPCEEWTALHWARNIPPTDGPSRGLREARCPAIVSALARRNATGKPMNVGSVSSENP